MSAEELRRSFKPDPVRMLLVGESPPAGGTFFYRANSLLFQATRDAFSRVFGDAVGDGAAALDFMARCGVYLEDLCLSPVDDLSDVERNAARKEGIEPLRGRIEAMAPECVVIVFLGAKREIRKAADDAGVSTIHELPFPLWYRTKYVNGLAALIRRYDLSPNGPPRYPQPPH